MAQDAHVDENGIIPPNALMNAKVHVDTMRSAQARRFFPPGSAWSPRPAVGLHLVRAILEAAFVQSLSIRRLQRPGMRAVLERNLEDYQQWRSWSALNDFMANIAVSSLVIQPNTTGATAVLYAGTGEGF